MRLGTAGFTPTSLPGELGGVEAESHEGADLVGRERAGFCFADAQPLKRKRERESERGRARTRRREKSRTLTRYCFDILQLWVPHLIQILLGILTCSCFCKNKKDGPPPRQKHSNYFSGE